VSSENSPNMTSSEEEKTQQCTKMPIEVPEENTSVTQASQQQTIEHDGGSNDTNNNSSQACEQNFTIYDMDSKSTERRSPCEFPATLRGTKRRRISGSETPDTVSMFKEGTECPNGLQTPNKRRRRSDGEDEEEERSSTSSEEGDTRESMEQSLSLKETSSLFNDSGYHGETSNNEVLDHPAFRASGIDSPTTPRGCGMIGASGQSSMEIDQITSLVSIFSFGQHIMAAQQRAASSSNSSSCTPLSSSITSISSPMLSTVASSCLSSSLSEPSIQLMSTKHEEKDDDNGEDEIGSDHISRRVRRRGNKKKSASIENAVPGEASDSESDTSSDSGHSSDDHDNSSEDKSSDTADDKSDEEISANESQNEENDEDILISQIERKRTLSTPSPVPDSFSCGSDNTKTVHADPCIQQVASV